MPTQVAITETKGCVIVVQKPGALMFFYIIYTWDQSEILVMEIFSNFFVTFSRAFYFGVFHKSPNYLILLKVPMSLNSANRQQTNNMSLCMYSFRWKEDRYISELAERISQTA